MPDGTRRAVALVLHDVAPSTWPLFREFVAAVDALGHIPLTLLTVPDYHCQQRLDRQPLFVKAMNARVARGDEIVLHGYYHNDPGPVSLNPKELFMRRIYTHEGEFYPLTEEVARDRLQRGLALFRELDWPVKGFVPPAWLLGEPARVALTGLPLAYTSSAAALIRLPGFMPVPAPSLVWSSGSRWRRQLSLRWNQQRLAQHRHAALLRLGIHPVDMRHDSVRRYWLDTLRSLLQTREPVTKSRWLELAR